MKQNWEYKKLGEVCLIERGGSPRPITAYITDAEDGVNWIKIGDAEEGSRYINSTKEKIKPEGVKKSRFVHKGDFILSNSMSFGKPYILGIDGCIHDGWLVIHDTNNTFDKDYLYYTLGSKNMYAKFKSLAVGGVVNNLNSDLVRKVSVPVPPLSTQTAIVSELDALSAIIADHKSLLKKYDELEQSIFYHMFGDPVKNDKGWVVKKLGEVCESIVRGPFGSALKKEFFVQKSETTYKVYEQKHAIQKDHSIGSYYITQDKFKELKRFEVKSGDIIMSCSGTIGELYQIPIEAEKGVMNQALLKFHLANNIEIPFFLFLVPILKDSMSIHGCGLQNIGSVKIIKELDFGLPDITLQKEFSNKVSAIEQMKADTKKSLAKSEELFNARMDYYFNA